jgi:hypothetical protein
MKENEIKKHVIQGMLETTKDDFSDRLMKEIKGEELAKLSMPSTQLPGRNLIIFLVILFTGSLIWLFNSPHLDLIYLNAVTDFLHLDTIHIKVPHIKYSTSSIYIVVGMFLFLWLDILIFSKKSYWPV